MEYVCPILIFLFMMMFVVAILAAMWKVFEKAGQPGWAAIVPIYNNYVLTCEIAKKEILWFILMFVPFISIVAYFIVCIEVAKKFGKDAGYGIGLAILPFVFFPMLAFTDAKYQGGGRRRDDYDDDYEDEPRPRKTKRRDDYDD
ncbi:MAG TPA: DUF5684 domain-containing protein [Urbifossiella sp.]|nr:DUF5684 domain-containing protein [Urbifossiella sp.]